MVGLQIDSLVPVAQTQMQTKPIFDSLAGGSSTFNFAAEFPTLPLEFNFASQEAEDMVGKDENLKRTLLATDLNELSLDTTKSKINADSIYTTSRAFLGQSISTGRLNGLNQQIKMTPLFTWNGKKALEKDAGLYSFDQIALLGFKAKEPLNNEARTPTEDEIEPIYLNTETPWSAFICGSQGSGKSHALSVMLENCLYEDRRISRLPKPLAGLVFHYDSQSRGDVCEAAYLASLDIPVRVLVSETNYATLKKAYEKIPGAGGKLTVEELNLRPEDMNTARLQTLMNFSEKNGQLPLYMAKVNQVLRTMARTTKDGGMLTKSRYVQFKRDLDDLDLTEFQRGPLDLRISLLEDYMKPRLKRATPLFHARPGELTIVDLSTPLLDQAAACSLFNICLELFLEAGGAAKVVALDEAHKYMGVTDASTVFTNTLLNAVRLQRHAGVRLVISTQEPTVSPKLLDLCSMTLVHRFSSPEWFAVLSKHIAGLAKAKIGEEEDGDKGVAREQMFREIVKLEIGESFLFAPTAMLDVHEGEGVRLGTEGVRIKTRMRLSADGGVSRLAGESM